MEKSFYAVNLSNLNLARLYVLDEVLWIMMIELYSYKCSSVRVFPSSHVAVYQVYHLSLAWTANICWGTAKADGNVSSAGFYLKTRIICIQRLAVWGPQIQTGQLHLACSPCACVNFLWQSRHIVRLIGDLITNQGVNVSMDGWRSVRSARRLSPNESWDPLQHPCGS